MPKPGPKPKVRVEIDEETAKEITKAAVDATHDIADKVFAESQKLVPVDQATLKKSGNVEYHSWGATISYNAAYAAPVHEGSRPHMPPVGPLIAWTRRKFGLDEDEARKAGWAVALKIKEKGTDATNFLRRAVESVGESLKSTLPDMVRRKIKFRFKVSGR